MCEEVCVCVYIYMYIHIYIYGPIYMYMHMCMDPQPEDLTIPLRVQVHKSNIIWAQDLHVGIHLNPKSSCSGTWGPSPWEVLGAQTLNPGPVPK